MNILEWKMLNRKRRNYAHFDSKVSLNNKVWEYINNPNNIEKHGFYPFIHYTIYSHKYNKKTGLNKKERQICYSAHIDRYIFQYYGYKLNHFYNNRVKEDLIDESVIAYRNNLHKNNIHFAKKAIDFIRQGKSCYIIIGDFTNFFDSLDHNYLKKMLCKLLNVEKLPADYYAVFKNVTKYSTWDLKDLLEINGFKKNEKSIKEFNKLKVALPTKRFKELKKQYLKPHSFSYGIPQGSAISAVLSNIYMLEFDKKIKDYISEKNGLYMRYSDDFIIILPKKDLQQFKIDFGIIRSIVGSIPLLNLEPKKTQTFECSNQQISSCNEDILDSVTNGKNSINYLGFTFDGNIVTIRDKTISKYYYRLYRKIKTINKSNGYTKRGNKISYKNVYLKYSIKGAYGKRGNFISYIKRAEKIFDDEPSVGRVARKHMQKIRKRFN